MSSTENISSNTIIDIVIIGGGIAGLWTLSRLHKAGYHTILVEANSLGCQQSNASQGIIHGGTKYALTGKLTHSAQSIGAMPKRWQDCLNGQGEVDLSQAIVLSPHQYLWSNTGLAAKLTGFFASKVMSSRMQHLRQNEFIQPFKQSGFRGELYQLDEPVLDIQSVLESLRKQFSDFIFQADIQQINKLKKDDSLVYQLQTKTSVVIQAKHLILTAGAGNEALLNLLKRAQPKMQRRPLLMPMLKGKPEHLPIIYAHCLGVSALPKMTISSYKLKTTQDQTEHVWYLGGEIAESGVGLSIEQQTQRAQVELKKNLPWMDFSQCQWSALAIDRAEPLMPDASRPVEPAVFQDQQVITAWPVKLAMTPIMVDKIMAQIETFKIKKSLINQTDLHNKQFTSSLNHASTGPLPWQIIDNWQ